ncbi:hypothetical protein ANN_23387 [Periplaneta americana]|uniref:Uncharacterized protein n=1 Tax=Periplaneta americana TaxID=6978 RepID=A0ABQ8SKZ7_PERAM|nr:hypothetical protein ANN_23387 [Periplaneta americana]
MRLRLKKAENTTTWSVVTRIQALHTEQKVHGLATQGSVRRIGIIAIKSNSAYILDPTITFETRADQPHEVDSEKKWIYEPTIPFYKDKYSLSYIDVIGLMVGARGICHSNHSNISDDTTVPFLTVNEHKRYLDVG